VPEEVLEARETINAATTTRAVGKVLEFVICCSERHPVLVYDGADAERGCELNRYGQYKFTTVPRRTVAVIMCVKVAAAEDRERPPPILMAFDGKFEMFECDMATTRRQESRVAIGK
jgi:hypothetical protein